MVGRCDPEHVGSRPEVHQPDATLEDDADRCPGVVGHAPGRLDAGSLVHDGHRSSGHRRPDVLQRLPRRQPVVERLNAKPVRPSGNPHAAAGVDLVDGQAYALGDGSPDVRRFRKGRIDHDQEVGRVVGRSTGARGNDRGQDGRDARLEEPRALPREHGSFYLTFL
jgi:hypothetical protein